jgi:outer membrane immunogenic protein
MKKFWLSMVGLVALGIAAPASAADLAVRPPPPAPPPMVVPYYNWTGAYAGFNGGWGNARNCWDFLDDTGVFFNDSCRGASGGVSGGQVGSRWQTGGWVWGVEALADWANLSASRVSVLDPDLTFRAKVDGIGLLTGQIGYAWDAALFYFKGGAAVTHNQFDIFSTLTGINLASDTSSRWGGTAGVGFEYGFTPNWSVGLEYDHLWMGNRNNDFVVVAPFVSNRISENVDMVTLRINYRFGGWAAPVAARY